MSDRFQRLFVLPSNLYAPNSPIIVEAGALLKDTQTDSLVIQLKFHSVSGLPIKALKVSVITHDVASSEKSGTVEYQYLDLHINNGDDFGSNKAIIINDKTVRSFKISSLLVVYTDGRTWASNTVLTGLPASTSLSSTLNDSEVIKQYQIDLNSLANNVPQEYGNLWQCACGEWNSWNDCTHCHAAKTRVFSVYDPVALAVNKDVRLAVEKEEIERKRAERTAALLFIRKKAKLIATIILPIIAIFVFLVYPRLIKPGILYKNAQAMLAEGEYDEAVSAFSSLNNYKDSEVLLKEAYYQKAIQLEEQGNEISLLDAIIILEDLVDYSDSDELLTKAKYQYAELLLADGKYADAKSVFQSIDPYERSKEMIEECEYREYLDSRNAQRNTVRNSSISAGHQHTVGLRTDGTVVAVGNFADGQCSVSAWQDIVSVSAGIYYTVGLKSDGTVVTAGGNYYGQCNVSGWTDIVAIDAGFGHTVGVKSNGTVVSTGWNEVGQCNVSNWTNIVSIVADHKHTVGLKSDGTVVAVGDNSYGRCDVSQWSDIVEIAAGIRHTLGLKADGTVVAVGSNGSGQCDVSEWKDIIAITAGEDYSVGLRSDGTVVATGDNWTGQCNVSGWTNIVAIAASASHTVGLKEDGTVVAVGLNDDGQCNTAALTNITTNPLDNSIVASSSKKGTSATTSGTFYTKHITEKYK